MIITAFRLWSLKTKAGLAIALLLVAWYFLERQKTRAFEAGQKSGIEKGWKQAEEQQREQWEAEHKRIKEDAARLAETEKQLSAQRAEIDRARQTFNRELSRQLEGITARNLQERTNVQTLSTSDVIPHIRATLDQLRSIELQRAGRGGPVAQR